MPTYIKAGLWEKRTKPGQGLKGELNLENLIKANASSSEAEDITSSQLYSNTINGLLIPEKWYRVTDYRSVNFLNGWTVANGNPTPTDPNFNPREVHIGDVEVLIVQAVSPYEISEIGYSETFQGDIVNYRPYVNKIAVALDLYNGVTLPDSSTLSGFDLKWDGTNVYFDMPQGYPVLYGQFLYLYCEFDGGNYYQDGYFDPITPNITTCQFPYSFDDPDYGYPKNVSRIKLENDGYKVVLLDLTETDYNNYDADTLCISACCNAIEDAYGWIVRRIDTFRNIQYPLDFRGRLYRRFEVDLSALNPYFNLGYYGIGDNYLGQGTTGNYKDFRVFGTTSDSQNILCDSIGATSNGAGDNSVILYQSYSISISGYFTNNTLGGCGNSKIDPLFVNNTIGAILYTNIGDTCQNNIISILANNEIGPSFGTNKGGYVSGNTFRGNTLVNTLGDGFADNTVGLDFSYNTIGDNFRSNTILNQFGGNTIGSGFNNNRIPSNFGSMTIGNDFRYNTISYPIYGINFSTATHVYGNYNCQIFNSFGGGQRLSYVDGTDTVQYTAITA